MAEPMLPVPIMLTCAMPRSSSQLVVVTTIAEKYGCINNYCERDDVTMDTRWLDQEQLGAWVRLVAVLELLPGVIDGQLRRDAQLTHFEYQVLAMLSEAPDRTLRMTTLATTTSATLPRLSHVVQRLEDRGLLERFPCPSDRRAT